MTTINMQTMRYINLLDRASNVKTKKCFIYNGAIFFAVPRMFVSKAIGPNALNVKRIQDDLGKRVVIISEPEGTYDIKRFIEEIVAPVRLKLIEIKDNTLILTAGNKQNKAALIGRDKRRFLELQNIIHDIFDMDLKII